MTEPARHLAQLNIGRLRYEADDPRMADFVDNLALVNGLAERSEGFVWRYQDDSGSAIDTRPFDGDPRMAINLSVWESVESAGALRLADRPQAVLRPPPRMVRQDGRALFRDVVGAGRPSADGQGGDRAARSFQAAWTERSRIRLGEPAGGAVVEDGAVRVREGQENFDGRRTR